MNGIHDMGGMQDMGPVVIEKGEPVFHARWEGRVFAMYNVIDGDWLSGSGRHERELIPPEQYLHMSYYERTMTSLRELLVKSGMVTRDELESGVAAGGNTKGRQRLDAPQALKMMADGWPSSSNVPAAPRFRVGERVRARNLNPIGHTREPRYVRGKPGTITRDHGVFVFNDALVAGLGPKPQHLYSVRFMAQDLWGAAASPADAVHADLWDDHLEPV